MKKRKNSFGCIVWLIWLLAGVGVFYFINRNDIRSILIYTAVWLAGLFLPMVTKAVKNHFTPERSENGTVIRRYSSVRYSGGLSYTVVFCLIDGTRIITSSQQWYQRTAVGDYGIVFHKGTHLLDFERSGCLEMEKCYAQLQSKVHDHLIPGSDYLLVLQSTAFGENIDKVRLKCTQELYKQLHEGDCGYITFKRDVLLAFEPDR